MENEERSDGVGIFVAEKWVGNVVSVERHSKRVLILKMILDNGLLQFMLITQGNWRRQKIIFGMKLSWISCWKSDKEPVLVTVSQGLCEKLVQIRYKC